MLDWPSARQVISGRLGIPSAMKINLKPWNESQYETQYLQLILFFLKSSSKFKLSCVRSFVLPNRAKTQSVDRTAKSLMGVILLALTKPFMVKDS